MKIYTRGGDDGSTSLIGGRRLPKYDLRVESYGSVDELIAWLGLIGARDEISPYRNEIEYLQGQLMCAAAALATDPSNPPAKIILPEESSIAWLEKFIDQLEDEVPRLNSFILPGGSETASYCHIARCVCRRAERAVVHLAQSEKVPTIVITLLNRTSDFLFVFARHVIYMSGKEDVKWVL